MSVVIENCLARLASRAGEVRIRTVVNDIHVLSARPAARDSVAAERASSYIWLCASLEAFVKEVTSALLGELNGLMLPRSQVKPSLFALLQAPEFDRLRTVTGQEMWNERASMFSRLSDPAPAAFAVNRLPLDGKTIQPRHLDTIGRVFAFRGSMFPTPRHKLALIDLSGMRNKLAHGEIEPVAFGRTKPYADMLRIISVVDDVGEHLTITILNYLSRAEYRR